MSQTPYQVTMYRVTWYPSAFSVFKTRHRDFYDRREAEWFGNYLHLVKRKSVERLQRIVKEDIT